MTNAKAKVDKVWTYKITTGELSRDGKLVGTGYSGYDEFKNDPTATAKKGVGPLPCGDYTIGPLFNSTRTGKNVMCLTAAVGTETFGRGDFEMHGDKIKAPGTASHGCIIMALAVRLKVAKSEDKLLTVIP